MTGYGRAEGSSSLGALSVEARSVNHRFCDISLRLSRKLSPLEGRIKDLVKSRFSRGRIELSVRVDSTGGNGYRLEPDLEMARQYVHALRTLKTKLRLKGEIHLDMIAQGKDIIVAVEPADTAEAHWEEIRQVLDRSLDGLKEMRRQEGESLAADLRKRIQSIKGLLERIKARAPLVLEEYRQRLRQRIETMVQGMELDPLRFNQEVAFFAERSDISEETVRITSHLAQIEQMIDSDEPVGRKLEFLLQEVHREANTISSKANDETISQMVVEVKGQLEKLREQIQNVE
jgi:uncharacterized protein (TIGR00255 family)